MAVAMTAGIAVVCVPESKVSSLTQHSLCLVMLLGFSWNRAARHIMLYKGMPYRECQRTELQTDSCAFCARRKIGWPIRPLHLLSKPNTCVTNPSTAVDAQ